MAAPAEEMGGWRDIGAYLKSAGFRFAVLFAVLFLAAILGFALMLWWGTAGTLSRQIDDSIRADAIGLQEAWRGGGASAVKEAIGERLAVDIDDHAIYLLVDNTGKGLAAIWTAGRARRMRQGRGLPILCAAMVWRYPRGCITFHLIRDIACWSGAMRQIAKSSVPCCPRRCYGPLLSPLLSRLRVPRRCAARWPIGYAPLH